ncbi:MAG TPA: hypothetical protein VK386_08300 [Acidimicrobiales bacterium]|nr:hypothetical protein [Acidimicrobiales bacterium]
MTGADWTILGTMLGGFLVLVGLVLNVQLSLANRIDCRTDRLDARMDCLDARMDRLGGRIDHLGGRIDALAGRSDVQVSGLREAIEAQTARIDGLKARIEAHFQDHNRSA